MPPFPFDCICTGEQLDQSPISVAKHFEMIDEARQSIDGSNHLAEDSPTSDSGVQQTNWFQCASMSGTFARISRAVSPKAWRESGPALSAPADNNIHWEATPQVSRRGEPFFVLFNHI